MRIGMPGTLSARIIAGFAVLILAFGAIAATAVLTAEQLEQSIRVIRVGYLELALKTGDLADKQQALVDYLKDSITEERSARRVETQLRRLRASRDKLVAELTATVSRVEELPSFRQSLDTTVRFVAETRKLIDESDPHYGELLAAPPIDLQRAEPAARDAALVLLQRVQQAEQRLAGRVVRQHGIQRSRLNTTSELLERRAGKMRVLTIWWGVTALVLGLLMTAWAVLNLRPLVRLRVAARQIAAGHYDQRIEERGPREVADLAREFNTMGAQVEQREKDLVRTERLAAVGKMAAVVTHEVRNPLSSIGLNTELLDEELAALPVDAVGEARALCRAIQGEVDRLAAITEEYLHFARLPQPRLQPEALGPIIRSLAAFEREPMARRGVDLTLDLADDLPPVRVDEGQLRQALRNLLRNAGEALDGRAGRVAVVARAAADHVEVRVIDDGPGVADDVANRLFDAFVTTKAGGTGLGLALTHQIIRAHGGTIRVDAGTPTGATFVVELPLARG